MNRIIYIVGLVVIVIAIALLLRTSLIKGERIRLTHCRN